MTVGAIERKEHEADVIFDGLLHNHGNVPEVLRAFAYYLEDIKHERWVMRNRVHKLFPFRP